MENRLKAAFITGITGQKGAHLAEILRGKYMQYTEQTAGLCPSLWAALTIFIADGIAGTYDRFPGHCEEARAV